MSEYKLILGDCIDEIQKFIDAGTKVDLTLTSPPYDEIYDYGGTLIWNNEILRGGYIFRIIYIILDV